VLRGPDFARGWGKAASVGEERPAASWLADEEATSVPLSGLCPPDTWTAVAAIASRSVLALVSKRDPELPALGELGKASWNGFAKGSSVQFQPTGICGIHAGSPGRELCIALAPPPRRRR
jgi:hypothetical protein